LIYKIKYELLLYIGSLKIVWSSYAYELTTINLDQQQHKKIKAVVTFSTCIYPVYFR